MTLPPLLAFGEVPAMGAILVRNFDYATLSPDVASMAAAAAAAIRTSTRLQITEVIASGRRLLEVKVALPHGAFGKWLEAEFGWTERTAQNYMRAAETYGSNTKCVSDLPLKHDLSVAGAHRSRVRQGRRLQHGRKGRASDRSDGRGHDLQSQDGSETKREGRRRNRLSEPNEACAPARNTRSAWRRNGRRLRPKLRRERQKRRRPRNKLRSSSERHCRHPDVQALIALIETSRMWLFLDALKQLGKVGDVCDDQRFAAERIVGGGQ